MSPAIKSHGSGCPIAFSLETFGDRWTLLLLRDLLLFGKQRYGELLAAEEGIASNILSDRLKRLETMDFIERAPDPDDGRRVIYKVTEKGRSLTPVVLEIAAWGAKHDKNTRAPKTFAERFSQNREAFYADPQGELAKIFAEESS
jgi:DNA-binding HxlR family transcriptional regulator